MFFTQNISMHTLNISIFKLLFEPFNTCNLKMQIPYFDRKVKHNVAKLQNHEHQKYIALFLSNTKNYDGIQNMNVHEKQNYFFRKYYLFVEKYYHNKQTEFDINAYYSSQHVSVAGATNVSCRDHSSSGRNQMLKQFAENQKHTKAVVDYMKEKYGLVIANKGDERVFIGHREPWWNPSPEMLKKDGWEWVTVQGYTDETFTEPIPKELDLQLVPLKIRNKVNQLWMKQYVVNKQVMVEQVVVEQKQENTEEVQVEIISNLKKLEEEMAEMEW